MRGGAGGVPGGADRAGRAAAARRPDHRDQRRRHDLLHPRTGEYDSATAGTQRQGERVIKFGSIREEIGLNLAAEAVAVPLSFSPPHPGQIHRSLLSVSQYHYCSSAASLSLMGV